ncbi:MAG: hypothetical protein MI755_16385 [Sphingomonadales bacterium]|nr:hypothetical protein [Sphingomonadales bacterium]
MGYFILTYHCYPCSIDWESSWSSIVNDTCPDCGTDDIEPYEVIDTDVDIYDLYADNGQEPTGAFQH